MENRYRDRNMFFRGWNITSHSVDIHMRYGVYGFPIAMRGLTDDDITDSNGSRSF